MTESANNLLQEVSKICYAHHQTWISSVIDFQPFLADILEISSRYLTPAEIAQSVHPYIDKMPIQNLIQTSEKIDLPPKVSNKKKVKKPKKNEKMIIDDTKNEVLPKMKNKKKKLVNALFFPSDISLDRLKYYLNTAEKTLDICMYLIASYEMTEHIKNIHKKGVKLRIITDEGQRKESYSQINYLALEGIEILTNEITLQDTTMHKKTLMHNKFVIIDDKIIMTGSHNWSENANQANDENILIIEHKNLSSKYKTCFENLWTKYLNNKVTGIQENNVNYNEFFQSYYTNTSWKNTYRMEEDSYNSYEYYEDNYGNNFSPEYSYQELDSDEEYPDSDNDNNYYYNYGYNRYNGYNRYDNNGYRFRRYDNNNNGYYYSRGEYYNNNYDDSSDSSDTYHKYKQQARRKWYNNY